MSEPQIVDRATIIQPEHLDEKWFSAGGRVIDDHRSVLAAFGVAPDTAASIVLPEVLGVAVQKARTGIVQDPAGSAVGSRTLSGGGASGAIYAAFPDLRPIPPMAVGAAVMNAGPRAARRVLHTHSPRLAGDPADAVARANALCALADAYANALFAAAAGAPALGADGGTLNLVPVSGSIFAGAFLRGRHFAKAHLDPSYTLVAIAVAQDHVRAAGTNPPALTICYFEADVARRASAVRDDVQAVLLGR